MQGRIVQISATIDSDKDETITCLTSSGEIYQLVVPFQDDAVWYKVSLPGESGDIFTRVEQND